MWNTHPVQELEDGKGFFKPCSDYGGYTGSVGAPDDFALKNGNFSPAKTSGNASKKLEREEKVEADWLNWRLNYFMGEPSRKKSVYSLQNLRIGKEDDDPTIEGMCGLCG